ncbi:hypothetical protein OG298_39815 [Streptomyces sp. NBC_01005]|uniref:hypothetical protein n=1 Tax=unclassified Streptomyces TaxID=2593676 RepID=UPI00386D2835|nr:hypothetical protein OG298_39815 [Streptomyces sp. NBC_01005]WTC99538.1 hypothetical protein OH736_39830 [Streptomyces sp. NBC_01650]
MTISEGGAVVVWRRPRIVRVRTLVVSVSMTGARRMTNAEWQARRSSVLRGGAPGSGGAVGGVATCCRPCQVVTGRQAPPASSFAPTAKGIVERSFASIDSRHP